MPLFLSSEPPEPGPHPPANGRDRVLVGLALAALALLYFLTIPANHTEAEDGFWYAYDTRARAYPALFHLHHLLYLPLMRLLYTAGHFPDAFQFMIGLDIVCAVIVVDLLYGWLYRGLRLSRAASVFACLFMAFSYGFWRYAVEAEVYLPAMVPMALLARRVFRRGQPRDDAGTWPGRALTAVLGAAAMLMHAPLSAPLAVIAVPAYFLMTRRWRALAVYGALATVLVTGTYYTAYRLEVSSHDPAIQPPPAASFAGFLAGAKNLEPGHVGLSNFPKAATGLGASVVSSNYLFAIPALNDKLHRAFPARNFTEEDYMARSFHRTLADLGLALTAVLLGLIAFVAVRRLEWSRERLRGLFGAPETLGVFLWLAAYGALVFVVEPEDPENWVCSLLPIAAVTGLLVHHLYRDLDRARLPLVFAGLLLTQNLIGGFLIIHHPDSDFNIHKGAWIIGHARAGDVVFTRDNEVFTRYLRYHTPADVVNCFYLDADATRAIVQQHPAAAGGTRYFFTDVVEPPGYLRVRLPTLADDLAGLRAEWLAAGAPTGADDVKRLP